MMDFFRGENFYVDFTPPSKKSRRGGIPVDRAPLKILSLDKK